MTKDLNLSTMNLNTWCPGCPNFMILAAAKSAVQSLIKKGTRQEDIVISAGIGCHAKIFDYLNLSGVYGLHGRPIPLALGMKLGNPNLKVLIFAGDGDTYSEGMSHFINTFRYNPDMTLIVHDNRDFSLTTGQSTPTTQKGYKNKAMPLGEFNNPINPVKIALASGAGFVARCNARDIEHTAKIIDQAISYKGFAFVEIIQDCLIFNTDFNNLDNLMYKVKDNKDRLKAEKLASEWDYNTKKGKIPIGLLYTEKKISLDEKWPQLKDLMKKKIGWKHLKK